MNGNAERFRDGIKHGHLQPRTKRIAPHECCRILTQAGANGLVRGYPPSVEKKSLTMPYGSIFEFNRTDLGVAPVG